jgi:hypothetical protein
MKIHTDPQKTICTVCGDQLLSPKSLENHMKTVHRAVHSFAASLTRLIEQPANTFADFTQAHSYVSELFREPNPVYAFEQCPHCHVNVPDLDHHINSCPCLQGPSWQ